MSILSARLVAALPQLLVRRVGDSVELHVHLARPTTTILEVQYGG